MVFKRIAAFFVFFHSMLLVAQQPGVDISFTVSMPSPALHKFHVVMQCKGIKKDTVEFKMPMWMPGYYQVMNYPDKLSQFSAASSTGKGLTWHKNSINSFTVETGGIGEFNISYEILADRSFVATSYLDEERGYLAPPGVFLYPAGMLNTSITLILQLNPAWNAIATGLTVVPDKRCTFAAADFDVLYDSPVLMGNLDSLPA